jgi:hypothetical protein
VTHIARGVPVAGDAVDVHRTRLRGVEFVTPKLDVAELVWPRTVSPPALGLPRDEVIDFLVETGKRLDIEKNEHLARACVNAARINQLPRDVSERLYRGLGRFFQRNLVEFEVTQSLGGPGSTAGRRSCGRPARSCGSGRFPSGSSTSWPGMLRVSRPSR